MQQQRGRFNFWRVLVLTQAITPPRTQRLLPRPPRHSWWAFVGLACLVVAAVARLGLHGPSTSSEPGSSLPAQSVQTEFPAAGSK